MGQAACIFCMKNPEYFVVKPKSDSKQFLWMYLGAKQLIQHSREGSAISQPLKGEDSNQNLHLEPWIWLQTLPSFKQCKVQSQTLLWFFFHVNTQTWSAKMRKVLPLALAKPAPNSSKLQHQIFSAQVSTGGFSLPWNCSWCLKALHEMIQVFNEVCSSHTEVKFATRFLLCWTTLGNLAANPRCKSLLQPSQTLWIELELFWFGFFSPWIPQEPSSHLTLRLSQRH